MEKVKINTKWGIFINFFIGILYDCNGKVEYRGFFINGKYADGEGRNKFWYYFDLNLFKRHSVS